MAEPFRRKTPDEILHSIRKINRGRLKIILGAVSGSGKTYHMLQEGFALKKRSIDVVMGTAAVSGHPRTEEQMAEFETIEPIIWMKDGVRREDLDVEAIISRNPEVILVDGLAHHNRPGSPNLTRLDDVLMLLDHNISVITTINIYELKEVKAVAEKLLGTKVKVDVCLPENTLALADEVKLLDVSPNDILSRLKDGSIDMAAAKERTESLLFERNNLAVLRKLALRFLAGEVDGELDGYRQKLGLVGPSGANERVLVPVQYNLNGSLLVRRGQQIAKRLGAELFSVCFLPVGKKLSKGEETFRRSIKKLVDKVEGTFGEVFLSNEHAAARIASHAIDKKITRIVMGQSKWNRYEELIRGSVINEILRKTRNIDIFIMADRSESNGERVIPAKRERAKVNPYERLSRSEMTEQIAKMKRGRLKVYVGAAPGVGKTYTMLREANELKKKGIDIVIGLLETHGRKETYEQVGSLDCIPRKVIGYKQAFFEEMDTDAIIIRNPEVVLVDELAHSNVPGSNCRKRYQDVEKILESGISVISTMNIQHVESLNDSIEQITGVRVRETVPDHILRDTDDIVLVDLSPEGLRQRMLDGNIYAREKITQSLDHFFKKENLIALRELALREVADDVDERLESIERKRALRGPWRNQEVIFVCVDLQQDGERLIRRGFRIAYRLKAIWYVGYVKDHPVLAEHEHLALERIKCLTERLGGIFETYEASRQREVVAELARQLHRKNATQVIIGKSVRTRIEEILKGSVTQRLLRSIRHLDVLVVADKKTEGKKGNAL